MTNATQKQPKRILLIIMLAPIAMMAVGSWLYFFKQGWVDAGITNEGYLLPTPASLAELGVQPPAAGAGKWRIILISPEACLKPCLDAARRIGAISILLGKDGGRVLPLLASDTATENLPPGLARWQRLAVDRARLRSMLATQGITDTMQHYALLADPLGNIVLFYQTERIGSELLTDLKRLLRLSRIG